MTQTREQFAEALSARFGKTLTRIPSTCSELTFEVRSDALVECCRALRTEDSWQFEQLIDITGVDYLDYGRAEWSAREATNSGFSRGVSRHDTGPLEPPERRFAAVYHLLSVTHNRRLRLRAYCEGMEPPILDSVVGVWSSADWFEREAFDLFGILFRGHPDLRRLLTDYGFIGHPFRKDFPLTGNVEVRYDEAQGRVVYEPVQIAPRTLVPRVIRNDNRYDEALKDAPGDA